MYNQNYLQQQSGDQSNNDHQQQPSQQQYQNSYPYGRNFGTPNSQGPVLQTQQSNSNLGQQQQSLDQQNYNNNAIPLSNQDPSGNNQYQGNASTQPQLWMGELDPRWDETIIRQIWTSILSPMDIVFHSVKVIRDKQALSTGLSNSGYCFLKFHNFDDATKVLNNFNGQPIPGTNNTRYFRLNWASSSNKLLGGSQPTVASHEFNIFVGDLNQDVKESTLFQIFQTRFPSTSGVRIMVDPITGNSKGYGFIKFLNEEEQKRALVEMQGMSVNGRPIRVSTATKSSLTVGSGQSNSPQPSTTPTTSASNLSNDGGNTTLPDTGSNVNSSVGGNFQSTSSLSTGSLNSQNQQQHNNSNNSNSSLNQSQPSQMIQSNNPVSNSHQQMQMQQRISLPPLPATIPLQYYNDPNNTTVFIGGLNVSLSESQLRQLFSRFGNITYVKIPPGKNCGFVQFYHRTSAEQSITEMQGYDVGGGCKIRVSWGARAAQRNYFAQQLASQHQNKSQDHHQQPQQHQQQQQQQQQQQSMLLSQQQGMPNDYLQNQQLNQQIVSQLSPPVSFNGSVDLGLNPSNFGVTNTNAQNMFFSNGEIDYNILLNEQIPFSQINGGPNMIETDQKLNDLLLAARDGNLDNLDLSSTVYKLK